MLKRESRPTEAKKERPSDNKGRSWGWGFKKKVILNSGGWLQSPLRQNISLLKDER